MSSNIFPLMIRRHLVLDTTKERKFFFHVKNLSSTDKNKQNQNRVFQKHVMCRVMIFEHSDFEHTVDHISPYSSTTSPQCLKREVLTLPRLFWICICSFPRLLYNNNPWNKFTCESAVHLASVIGHTDGPSIDGANIKKCSSSLRSSMGGGDWDFDT